MSISVVIPTLNAESCLPACLTSIEEGRRAGLVSEVIVSDGGSSDDTQQIATDFGARIILGAPSRGGQLRRGCAEALGDWLLIVHADSVLSPSWPTVVPDHLSSGAAGWFRLAFDDGGVPARLVSGWANFRSRLGLPYGDQGLLLPVALYREVGGYPDQPLMEDVAIARRLRGRLIGLNWVIVTSAQKYQRQGWLRRGGRNLWTLLRYLVGVPSTELARSYNRDRNPN